MEIQLLRADRGGDANWNESKARDMTGCLVSGGEIIQCYFPSEAALKRNAVNFAFANEMKMLLGTAHWQGTCECKESGCVPGSCIRCRIGALHIEMKKMQANIDGQKVQN